MDDRLPSLRVAADTDVPALASLWAEAFTGTRGVEDRIRELREGMAYGTIEDCRLLELEGRLAAALRIYRMELHFGGRRYPCMGLAGVAVAADFRRRGLGRRICVEALREGRRRGDALSLLYPFKVSFYTGLGYALAGELHQYRFRTGELPLFEGWERVERAVDGEVAEAIATYGRVASRSNGMLVRERRAWRAVLAGGVRLYLYRAAGGQVTGYAAVKGRRTRQGVTLRVRELVWEDEVAYRALLGWVSAQRDQYVTVTYDALPSESFGGHLSPPRREAGGKPRGLWFETARILRGPMLRVLHVGALQDLEAPEELRVEDAEIPENGGLWHGGCRSAGEGAGTDALTPVEVTRRFLAGSLPGQTRPPEGWAPSCGITDFRLLDEF